MKRWVVETRTHVFGGFMVRHLPTFRYSLHRWRWSARLHVWAVEILGFSPIAYETARITGRVTIWRKDDMQQAARWAERCQRRWLEEWERPRVSALSVGQMAATAGEELKPFDAVMWDDGKIWRASR